MLSLRDRFELLEADLLARPPAFIMSRNLPFAIFRYDPNHPEEREWKVRKEIDLLTTRVANQLHKRIESLSLAELFWQSIQESEGVDAIVELERDHGFETAERQVNSYLSDRDFRPLCELLLERAAKLPLNLAGLFLMHATVFAPGAYRISSLLHGDHPKPAIEDHFKTGQRETHKLLIAVPCLPASAAAICRMQS